MKWLNDYNVGISTIDQQHKKLFHTIVQLQESLNTTDANKQMATTLKFMVDYTQHHFNEEEEIMQSIGFPDIEQQKELHKKLIKNIKEVLLKLKNEEPVKGEDIITFLTKWLKDHILEEDLKIGEYIQNNDKNSNIINLLFSGSTKKNLQHKLLELKSLFTGNFITKDEYRDKRSYLLLDFIDLHVIESKIILNELCFYIKELTNQKMLMAGDYKIFQIKCFEKIDLDRILDNIQDSFKKIEYIKFLGDEKLISSKIFKVYKKKLLNNL